MNIHVLRVAALASLLACAAACSRSAARESGRHSPEHTRHRPAYIEVRRALRQGARRARHARATRRSSGPRFSTCRVEAPTASPVVGRYQVVDDALRFTPLFPSIPAAATTSGSTRHALPAASAIQLVPRIAASVSLPRPTRVTVHRRHARLSERRRDPGEPAADVHRVLGADGTPKRDRVRRAARRAGRGS